MPQGDRPASAADDLARRAAPQQGELARDQKIGRRVVTGLRVWFLVVVPLGLISTAFVHALSPLWPYSATIWASGPAAALLALRICRRPSRQVQGQLPGPLGRRLNTQVSMVSYTSRVIAHVSGIVSVVLVIASAVTIGAYAGSSAHSRHAAQKITESWHVVFAVLPALVLCVAIRVIVSRTRSREGNHVGRA